MIPIPFIVRTLQFTFAILAIAFVTYIAWKMFITIAMVVADYVGLDLAEIKDWFKEKFKR